MSSELLLEWMSLYPKKEISEQVVNRACLKIKQAKSEYVSSISELRREYILPLLKCGHIEFSNNLNTSYSVVRPTLLEINSLHTICCGARTESFTKSSLKDFNLNGSDLNLQTYWTDKKINMLKTLCLEHYHISKITVAEVLSKIPQIDFESICGNKIDSWLSVEKMKRFEPRKVSWEVTEQAVSGVYRERDDIPATALPWIYLSIDKSGNCSYKELYTYEMTSVALCLVSIIDKQLSLSYNKQEHILKIILPKNVYLPLMIERPLTWLSLIPQIKKRDYSFNNIDKKTVDELSRIFNTKVEDKL